MTRAIWIGGAVVVGCLAAACTSTNPRGEFAAISTRASAMPMTVVATDATGKHCQPRHRLDLAVNNAIAAAPGANSLVNVKFTLRGLCLEARGTAVRTGSR